MSLRFAFCLFLGQMALAAMARAGEIRGKVTDAQGAALISAAVTVEQLGIPARSAQTGSDGAYSLTGLVSGRYTLRAQKAGFAEQRQGPVELSDNNVPVVVNFRLAASAETEVVRGAEERNPNDFVIRLDTNAITNELGRTGTNLRFLNEFRADRNYYGEPFGYPLRSVELAAASRPLGSFHGSVSEFHQDNVLNARPFFQVGSLLPSRRNQYGFSVSGPIIRQRLSFVFAWGQVRDSGFVNGNVQVPLANERAPLRDDNVPSSLVPENNAIIAALLKAYPEQLPNLPQVSERHLNTNAFRDIHSTAFSLHLDGSLSRDSRLAFDQQFSNSSEEPFELVIGQNPQTTTKPQTYHLTYSRTVSPRTVLQLSLNYDRLAAVLLPTERYQALLAGLGINQVPDFDLGDEFSNIGLPNQGMPRKRYENHYLLTPQLIHSAGRHNFAAGFSVKHLWDSELRSSNGRGTYLFSRDFTIFDPALGKERTATAVENFLLARPSRLSMQIGNQYRGYRNWEYTAYFQDRFQVRKGLTLSYGLRYEVLTAPHEVSHLFDFQHHTDANNFAPQFGFAWSPSRLKAMVRGGYGIAFGTLTLASWNRQASNPPLVNSLSVDAPNLFDMRSIPFLVPDPTKISGSGELDRNAVLPYSHLYNFSVERELPGAMLIRLGYQGSRTFKMPNGWSLNRAVPVPGVEATTRNVNARRPDKLHLRIYDVLSASNGYHDGLQLSVTKRRTRGLSAELRYSFSKTLDSSISNFADTGNGGDNAQTEEVFHDVKSVSTFDTPQSLTMTFSYDLPRWPDAPDWADRALRRWTVSGTTTFRSGTPFALFTGSDGPGTGNIDGETGDRPNLLDPSILGKSFDNPDTSYALMGANDCADVAVSATVSYRRCKYFDTNLAVGGRGSVGYRVFRKDGTNNWNMALARSFALPAEKQIQFRAELYNFFNHAQFAAPGNAISSRTFGQITNTVNKGRVTQLTLRLVF